MRITHMSGAGNDFAVIDARGLTLDFSKLALELCRRLDCDGFMAVDTSEIADFRLHFYNADGSRGEMCGNGSRCICKFAYDLGIAGEEMTVQTDAGIVYGWRLGENQYRVKLNNPGTTDLKRKEDVAYIELGTPGVPHAVKRIEGLKHEDREKLRQLGVSLRYDLAFPKGANVNFYDWLDESTIRILTYERGVEDYPRACGTGSASVVSVLHLRGELSGNTLAVENPGGTLGVRLEGDGGRVQALYLEGPAEVIKEFEM